MLYLYTQNAYTQFDLADKFKTTSRKVVKLMKAISERTGFTFTKDSSMCCHYPYEMVSELAILLQIDYVEVIKSRYVCNDNSIPF